MASITFEFLSRGADGLAADFGKVGDGAAGASRGAKVLQDVIERLGSRENRTAEESRRLAQALRLTGDAADRAAAKVVVADAAIRRLADAEAEASRKAGAAGGGGIFSRLLGAAGSAFTPAGGGGGAGPLPGFLSSPAAIAAIAAGLAALLPEIVAVGSGFAAAGTGAGAFALLAAPAFKKVETAYSGLNTAQQAYAAAQAKYIEAPTKANATALANARLQLDLTRDSLAKLPRSEQDAVTGLQGLVAQFGKLSAAFAPQAFRIFADLLKIADNLLPVVTPFATAFAGALDGILKQAAKFTGSQGFRDWLAQFQKLTGPSLTAIGEGIGHLVTSFGKLLTIFSAKDVVNAINIAFSVLDGTLIVLIRTTEFMKSAWDKLTNAFVVSRHQIANVFDGIRHDIADWGRSIASVFDQSRANVARWALDVQRAADSVVKWFQQLPGKITSALGSAGTVLLSWGKGVIQGLLTGMTSVIGQVWAFIKSIPGKILSFLGIKSPPDWAIEAGKHIMNGVGIGMQQSQAAFARASASAGAAAAASLGAGGDAAANRALARQTFPWPASQWSAFDYVAMRESGYNRFARNPASGAYGIPQALPESKLPPAGRSSGGSHAGAQLSWMFSYIAGRYGTPAAAAAHEKAFNWYGSGFDGVISRPTLIGVGERGPEHVTVTPGGDSLLAEVRALRAELRHLTAVAAAIPASTGRHVTAGVNSAAAGGSFRRRYPS
jgi:hypothetical protein